MTEGTHYGLFIGFDNDLNENNNSFTVNDSSLTAISATGHGIATNNPTFDLNIGPEATLILDSVTPVVCTNEDADFTYTVENQGSLSVKTTSQGGAVTLELNNDVKEDLTIPAGADLVINGDGKYAIEGTITCETEGDKATNLTLKNLILEGSGNKTYAVYAADEKGSVNLTLEGCTVCNYTGRAIYLPNATTVNIDGSTFHSNATNDKSGVHGDGCYPVDLYFGEMDLTGLTITNSSFDGVAESAWYYDAVCYVWESGLMNNMDDSLFGPDITTSRAMLTTILWRMEGSPVVNYAMDFTDVSEGQWYTEAIRWATSEKIIEGYGDNRFGINEPITREQFVTILYRYAQAKGYDVSVGENTNILSYADAAEVSEYAVPAMQWACGTGVISGDGDTLVPQEDSSRAITATMLMRFCENVAK